jgi:hypothetical protein
MSLLPIEPPVVENQKRYAIVSTTDASEKSILECLVLGESLKRPERNYNTVLLAYSPMSPESKQALKATWDAVIEAVDFRSSYHGVDPYLNVLHALCLTNYNKVLVVASHTIAADSLNEVFELKAPAVAVNSKDFAWLSGVHLPNEALMTQNDERTANIRVLLLNPSLEEFEEALEILDSDRGESSGQCASLFVLRFFRGSWYSLSHEYNYKDRFVTYGERRTFGSKPEEQECLLVNYCAGITPADMYFFSDEVKQLGEIDLPRRAELVRSIEDWQLFPEICSKQSAHDRFMAIYRCWFKRLLEVSERLMDEVGLSLFQVAKPSLSCSIVEIKERLEEQRRSDQRKEKAKNAFRIRTSHGRNSIMEVTDSAIVTRCLNRNKHSSPGVR